MLVNVIAPFLFCFSFVFVCFVWEYREVGKAVAKIIALALDLDANFFDRPEILGEPIAILRLLHYEGIESIAFILGIYTEFSQQPRISCTEFNIPHLGSSLKFSIFACPC